METLRTIQKKKVQLDGTEKMLGPKAARKNKEQMVLSVVTKLAIEIGG